MTEVYLRDLSESEQRAFLTYWENKARIWGSTSDREKEHYEKLLKAHKKGKDIVVGEYFNDYYEIKVVE